MVSPTNFKILEQPAWFLEHSDKHYQCKTVELSLCSCCCPAYETNTLFLRGYGNNDRAVGCGTYNRLLAALKAMREFEDNLIITGRFKLCTR
jgi:hypothetical protein